MPEIMDIPARKLDRAHAANLAILVDLEARWENLRTTSGPSRDVQPTTLDLHGKQKAYEAFRARLAVFNKQFAPAHVPELLLNTPARLGKWCRTMRDLYIQVENEPQGHCPAHLLEKAYRWADQVAGKKGTARFTRSTPPGTIRAAIQDLEALGQWCDDLGKTAAAE